MDCTHKYKVAVCREGEPFGVGIERYSDAGIEWIGSFYLPHFSWRMTFQFAVSEIRKQIGAEDTALIRVNDPSHRCKREWVRYYPDITLQYYHFSKFPGALALAHDALLRHTDITETLNY